jgi:hypothetical protein
LLKILLHLQSHLREKILELENNPAYINKIAKDGAEKARISARSYS